MSERPIAVSNRVAQGCSLADRWQESHDCGYTRVRTRDENLRLGLQSVEPFHLGKHARLDREPCVVKPLHTEPEGRQFRAGRHVLLCVHCNFSNNTCHQGYTTGLVPPRTVGTAAASHMAARMICAWSFPCTPAGQNMQRPQFCVRPTVTMMSQQRPTSWTMQPSHWGNSLSLGKFRLVIQFRKS